MYGLLHQEGVGIDEIREAVRQVPLVGLCDRLLVLTLMLMLTLTLLCCSYAPHVDDAVTRGFRRPPPRTVDAPDDPRALPCP